MVKKLEGAGLRGQVAGETSLCTVGQVEGLASGEALSRGASQNPSDGNAPAGPAPSETTRPSL